MKKWPYTKGLHDIGNACYAYLQPDGTWGYSNSGLVVDGGEALLVDTLMDLKLTREMLDRMRAAVPVSEQIGTLVNTHSNPDHTNGNQLVAGAQIITSTACLEEMKEQSSAPRYPMTGDAGAFFQEVLGSRFDFSNIRAVLPSRTFDRELTLRVGSKEVRLLEMGPAHTRGDIVIHVPADKTVFTGDILFAGWPSSDLGGPRRQLDSSVRHDPRMGCGDCRAGSRSYHRQKRRPRAKALPRISCVTNRGSASTPEWTTRTPPATLCSTPSPIGLIPSESSSTSMPVIGNSTAKLIAFLCRTVRQHGPLSQ